MLHVYTAVCGCEVRRDREAERVSTGKKMQVRKPTTVRKDMPALDLVRFGKDPRPALGNL